MGNIFLSIRQILPLCKDLYRILVLILLVTALVYPSLFFFGIASSIILSSVIIWNNIRREKSLFSYWFLIDGTPLLLALIACVGFFLQSSHLMAYQVLLVQACAYLVALLLPVKTYKTRYLYHFMVVVSVSLCVVFYYILFTDLVVPYRRISIIVIFILFIYNVLRSVFLFMCAYPPSPITDLVSADAINGVLSVSVFLRCIHQGCYLQITQDSTWVTNLQQTESPSQAIDRLLATLPVTFGYPAHYQYSRVDGKRMIHYYYLIMTDSTPLKSLYPDGSWVALPENKIPHA